MGHISVEERLRELNRLYDEAERICAAELRRYDDENERKKRRRLERFRAEMAPVRREAAALVEALGHVDSAKAAMMVLPEEPSTAVIPRFS